MYHRYVNDFLNSHTYTDRVDAAGLNEHNKNFHIMEELLTLRKDLVQRYFTKENLHYSDFLVMHHEFNTTEQVSYYETSNISNTLPDSTPSKPDFECFFNSIQIRLITRCMNAAHLFTSNVSEVEVEDFFNCCLKYPLKSACNRRVAFFFDDLCKYKLITTRWQHVIDKNRLILSSAKNVFLNSGKLSTALNEAKQSDRSIYRTIELHIKEIEACGEYNAENIEVGK